MGKLFGLILMLLAIWIGLEIYEKGVDRACGGVFGWFEKPIQGTDYGARYGVGPASGAEPTGTQVRGSIAQQVGAKVRSEINGAAAQRHETEGDEDDND